MHRRASLLPILLAILAVPVACGGREAAPAPAPAPEPMAIDRGWERAMDPAGEGVRRGWPTGTFAGTPVQLPDVANAEPGDPETGVAWYRTTVAAPANGEWRLRFGSAHFDATVWVDGRRLGSHRGAYEPFSFVLAGLRAGEPHTLVVRTDYRDPDRQIALGFDRGWFNWGGLNGRVRLEPLGASALETPAVDTRLDPADPGHATVRVAVTVRNRTAASRVIEVHGALGTTDVPFPPVAVAAHRAARIRAGVRVPAAALWSPAAPRMTELRLEVPGETRRIEQTGLREVRVAGSRLLVNGQPVRFVGASIQPDAPGQGDALDARERARVVAQLRAIGATATRAQHSLDPALLDAFDRAGILVWQAAGPFESPGRWRTGASAALTRAAATRTLRQVAAERLHPSIVAWSLVNEVAGNGTGPGQADYVQALTRTLHRSDPGRLVAVDVWGTHIPARAGRLYDGLDAVGVTNYTGWHTRPLDPPRARRAATRAVARRFARVFAPRLRVVTEFGAGANPRNPQDALGGYRRQAVLLAEHLRVYERTPGIAGALVWSLRDFRMTPRYTGGSARRLAPSMQVIPGLNDKGLFTGAGEPKPAAGVVAGAFARAR